jgi:hypothetical protein
MHQSGLHFILIVDYLKMRIPFFAYLIISSTTAEDDNETHLGAFLL